MREIELKLGELGERKIAAEDQLARVEIRSPQDGFVHQSSVHTVGGVIPAGDSIMLIVPRADRLTIEARVSPTDIDQISMGQQAMMRFSAFNQRTTPEIAGKVELISADIATDERTGISYYIARITVAPDEVARLGNVTLIPGMPVDVFINTGARTVASYITKPITDNWEYVFRNE
jgi:HlyD family secretion protein